RCVSAMSGACPGRAEGAAPSRAGGGGADGGSLDTTAVRHRLRSLRARRLGALGRVDLAIAPEVQALQVTRDRRPGLVAERIDVWPEIDRGRPGVGGGGGGRYVDVEVRCNRSAIYQHGSVRAEHDLAAVRGHVRHAVVEL